MQPAHNPAAPIRCGLAASASVRLSFAEIAALRKQPPVVGPDPLPATFLKHSDEQTVAALAALADAMRRAALPGPFTHWAAVASTRHIGRLSVAGQVPRFLAEGAWGVSPHVIPHRSLHSPSGTISQALKLHGPNFGAGGGPGGEAEGLLCARALIESRAVPGVWFVTARLAPEGPLDAETHLPIGDGFAEATAIALVAADSPLARRELTMGEVSLGNDRSLLSVIPQAHFPHWHFPEGSAQP